jgi:hypothetical protein
MSPSSESRARGAAPAPAERGAVTAIRLAILSTTLAVVLGLTLLIEEKPLVFTAFMVLGPTLLLLAFVLLGVVILRELRSSKVL